MLKHLEPNNFILLYYKGNGYNHIDSIELGPRAFI